jgi:hypothetical protein
MNQETIIAIVGSTATIILSMFGMFLWVRSEANNDRRSMQAIQREDRKDFLEIIRAIEMEMKDFHNRLCLIEMERKTK